MTERSTRPFRTAGKARPALVVGLTAISLATVSLSAMSLGPAAAASGGVPATLAAARGGRPAQAAGRLGWPSGGLRAGPSGRPGRHHQARHLHPVRQRALHAG